MPVHPQSRFWRQSASIRTSILGPQLCQSFAAMRLSPARWGAGEGAGSW